MTCYPINSKEGKDIFNRLSGVGGHFNPNLLGSVFEKIIVCKEPFNQGKWQIETFSTGEGGEDKLTMKDIKGMYKDMKEERPVIPIAKVEHIQLPGNKTGHRSCPSKFGDKTAVLFDKKSFEPFIHDVNVDGGALFVDAVSPEGKYELMMASTSDVFGELVSKELAEVSAAVQWGCP